MPLSIGYLDLEHRVLMGADDVARARRLGVHLLLVGWCRVRDFVGQLLRALPQLPCIVWRDCSRGLRRRELDVPVGPRRELCRPDLLGVGTDLR